MYNLEEMTKLLNEELSQSLVLDGTKIQWYADRVKKMGKRRKNRSSNNRYGPNKKL